MDDTANENEDLSEKMQSLVSSMRDFREKQEDSGVLIRNAKRNEPRLTLSQKLKNAGLYHERETFESSDIYKSQFANRELEMPAYLSNTSARKKILEGYRNEKDALEVAWDRLTLLDRRAPPVRYLKLSNKKRVRLPRKLTLEHALLELYIRSELMEREGDDHKKIKILPTMPIKEVSRALSVTEYDLRQVVLALGREIPQIDTFHMLAHEVETVCKYLDHPYEFGEFKKADIKPSNYTHGADRPPVVTVMGHVNHGKTTLLDTFRKKKVAPIEVGGITQSVASFTVRFKGKHPITFFDTPGHSVFSTMRKNVAKVTDLVIIIIAANEGLQSQTLDSIKTAQAYGIPILVAVNKCDLVGKDIDTQILSIKEQLAGAGVELEDMGGDVQVVKISAKTGSGLDELEDSILLAAEMLELKAPIDVPAQALIVETRTDPGMGHIVLAVVKHGILKLKDNIVSGEFKGVVRNMYDWDGTPVKEAGPSIPVLIKGLEGTPAVGDFINVVDTSKKARDVVHVRQAHNIDESDNAPVETKIEDPDQAKKELSVIVKANLSGSLQSLLDYLSRVIFYLLYLYI
jgi:translation initiation factor IF-2